MITLTVKDIRAITNNSHIEVYEMFGGFLSESTNDEGSSNVDDRCVVYIQGYEDVLEITVC